MGQVEHWFDPRTISLISYFLCILRYSGGEAAGGFSHKSLYFGTGNYLGPGLVRLDKLRRQVVSVVSPC